MTGSEMLKNAFFRKTALERLFIDRFDSGFLCFEDFDSLQRIAVKHFRNSKFCSRDFCAVIFCFFKLVFICLEKFWNYLVLLAFDGRSQLYSQFFFSLPVWSVGRFFTSCWPTSGIMHIDKKIILHIIECIIM